MTTPRNRPARAVIYCRISLADMGDTTKVADQERICRDLARQRGWQLAGDVGYPEPNGVFTDNNRSAWQRGVKRPGWNAMLEAVESGKANAIVAYHGDRLARQPRDLEKLIDLAEGKGIRLASSLGDFNLDRSQDRIFARVIAAFAEGESARTSERRKSQFERWRREGRVRTGGHGGRAFGFATDGVTHFPADRCSLVTRAEVVEADVLRECARRLLAGDSVRAVVIDLAARGITTPAGTAISSTTLKRIMISPRLAGLMPDGEQKAAWDPVLDRADWEALRILLSSHAPNSGAGRGAVYLLSGVARCICGHAMYAGEKKAEAYRCPRPDAGGCGKVRRNRLLLDEYVIFRLVARLGQDANPGGQIAATPGLQAEFAALAGQRAEIEEALKDHRQSRVTLLMARLDSLDARLEQLREMSGHDARARLAGEYAGITVAEFRALPLPVQRSLVRAFLDITVLPASRRGPGLRTEDLRVVPR